MFGATAPKHNMFHKSWVRDFFLHLLLLLLLHLSRCWLCVRACASVHQNAHDCLSVGPFSATPFLLFSRQLPGKFVSNFANMYKISWRTIVRKKNLNKSNETSQTSRKRDPGCPFVRSFAAPVIARTFIAFPWNMLFTGNFFQVSMQVRVQL